jgi:hypothetical protein
MSDVNVENRLSPYILDLKCEVYTGDFFGSDLCATWSLV